MRRLVLLLTILACLAVPAALAKGSFPETIPLPNGFAARGDRGRQGRHLLRRLHSDRRGLRRQPPHRDGQRPRARRDRSRGDRAQVRPRPAVGLRRGDRQGVRLQRPDRRRSQRAPARDQRRPDVHQRRRRHMAGCVLHRLQPPVIYKVSKSWHGAPGSRDRDPAHRRLPARAGVQPERDRCNAERRTLLAVQSATGKLFTIDPKTGATKLIDLGGATLPNGDGILLHGRTLYVVQNQLTRSPS